MNVKFTNIEFYKELELHLSTSTGEIRKYWATEIVEKDIDIKYLAKLLKSEHKTATRFLWLLTDIGQLNQKKLFIELPYLFDFCSNLNIMYKQSFATFWLTVGVPPQNESNAIDLLFQLLLSNSTNITIKSRALLVLFKLTKKYPELKNELRLCLTDQIDRYSDSFKKRATKILAEVKQ